MTRSQYVLRRLVFAVVTVIIAVTVNFFIFRAAPGDPVSQIGLIPNASPEVLQHLRHDYGVDRPVFVQYSHYLKELVHGHLGVSTANHALVTANLKQDILNTLPMVVLASLFAIAIGLLVGVLLAWMRNTRVEGPGLTLVLATYAAPTQWIGLILLTMFAGTLPSGGIRDEFLVNPSFGTQAVDLFRHMILPATALGLAIFGQYAFIVRASMLDVLGEDFMLTARAKGLPIRRQLIRHGLRNALLPITSLAALILGSIVGGTILVETVFSYPGIGEATAQAVTERDYPMLQGAFLVLTVSVVVCNLIADLLVARLDPRVTS
jgi:ABC-type dipeptide/oligopeptide/nickel transport system permease component